MNLLLERAEKLARLAKIEGSDFHAYRRTWATERKHLPDVDVAAAGAWTGTRARKLSYQQSDEQSMYNVVSDATKLRDAKPTDDTAETADARHSSLTVVSAEFRSFHVPRTSQRFV